jgi:hypothetical protein
MDRAYAATQLFDDAAMEDAGTQDGLIDHGRKSYVSEILKSMKAIKLAPLQKDCRCNLVSLTMLSLSRQGPDCLFGFKIRLIKTDVIDDLVDGHIPIVEPSRAIL